MDALQMDFGLHLDTARLQEFLAKLCRSQDELNKCHKELAATVENVLQKLENGERGVEEQHQALQSLHEKVLGLSVGHDALRRLRIDEKLERFDNHHIEFKNFETRLAQFNSKIKSSEADVSNLEGRVVAVEEKQNGLEEKFEKLLADFSSLKAYQSTVAIQSKLAETCCKEIEKRQDELATSVENKYDLLWRSVEHSLERISTAELEKYHKDVQSISGEIEKRMQAQISYCLDILAKATETHKCIDLKRAVILRWREQAWLNSKRKIELLRLAKRIYLPMRVCFQRWVLQARWASEVEQVKKECKSMIPNLNEFFTGAVNPRLNLLEQSVEAGARKTDKLLENTKNLWENLQLINGRARALECKSEEDANTLTRMNCELESHARFRQEAEERVQRAEGAVAQLSEQLALVAREVKQLDAAKADRTEVERLGVELNSTSQTVSENLAKLELDQTKQLQDTAVEQGLSRLQSELKDSSGRHEELGFMLGLVVKLLEDIVNFQLANTQARRTATARAGHGRIESRLRVKATASRACGADRGTPKKNACASPMADQPGVAGIAGGEKGALGVCCSTPSVAAFAEWVESVRKAVELGGGTSECSESRSFMH